MVNIIKLRKGLDIKLKGSAQLKDVATDAGEVFALCPEDFHGVTPKVVVKEGDKVLAGDALFVNKRYPSVCFASPVSGTVLAVERGERRKVLAVKVKADKEISYKDFGKNSAASMSGEQMVSLLLEAGLFGFINQLPYAISTNPETMPRAIFVSAFRDMPLAGNFAYELKGNEEAFQTGITALSRIAKVFVGINADEEALLGKLKDAEVTLFKGKCPAGNVGVQINNLAPVNKNEVVWTVSPTVVYFIGRLLLTGKVDLRHKVALAGSEVKDPAYSEVLVGQSLSSLTAGRLNTAGVRVIKGNPLTGVKAEGECFLGPQVSEVTVIPEGSDADEMLGWIMPRLNQFSASRTYFSWLMPSKKEYVCDARIKGGERHMIMSGEYDKVLPMDIYGEYLIKAIITEDIDKQEALGIYEVSPEDFAVAEFVCSSKLPLQKIVREGLDILRKENE